MLTTKSALAAFTAFLLTAGARQDALAQAKPLEVGSQIRVTLLAPESQRLKGRLTAFRGDTLS